MKAAMAETARVWVLLCSRTGANNQALALAKAIGLPFAAKSPVHNRLRRVARFLGGSRLTLDYRSRLELVPPWPDVVIAVAKANVPVARWIKRRSGGTAKLVFLGNPRVDPKRIDLVVTTVDYLTPRGENVLVLPLPVTLPARPGGAEPAWCNGLPRPRTLFLIGGPIKHWSLNPASVGEVAARLASKARRRGGSLVVAGSPRTPESLIAKVGKALVQADNVRFAPSRTGGLEQMLACVDEIIVTGDSMAMVTEAILTGKPTGVMPLELTRKGKRKLGRDAWPEGSPSKRRDLRRFWSHIWARGLAGTVDDPKAARAAPTADLTARAVLSLLGGNPGQPAPEVHERQ